MNSNGKNLRQAFQDLTDVLPERASWSLVGVRVVWASIVVIIAASIASAFFFIQGRNAFFQARTTELADSAVYLVESRLNALSAAVSGIAADPTGNQAAQLALLAHAFDEVDRARLTDEKRCVAPDGFLALSAKVPDGAGQVACATVSKEALLRMLAPTTLQAQYRLRLAGPQDHSTWGSSPQVVREVRAPAGAQRFSLLVRAADRSGDTGTMTLTWTVGILATSLILVLALLGRFLRHQMQVESRLRGEAAVRRAMQESQAFGLMASDLSGQILYVNNAFERLTSYSKAELLGTRPPYPFSRDRQPNDRDAPKDPTPASGRELTIRPKDGPERHVIMWANAMINPDTQEVDGWVTTWSDITEERRVRAQLASSHERFTTVLQSLDAAVSVVSAEPGQEGELLFCNSSYLRHFGSNPSGHRRLLAQLRRTTIEENGGTLGESHLTDPEQWFDVRVRTIRWVDGQKACLQIASNITERKKEQRMLEQQQLHVEKTSRLISMGEMASSIAHEINQPLAAISNYAAAASDMLKAGRLSPQANLDAFDRILKQARRTAVVIKRIRSFVKKSEPVFAPAPVPSIIESAVELAQIEAKRHGVTIRTSIQAGLPQLTCDRVMIEQLILNLTKNAAEASADASDKTVRVVAALNGNAVNFSIIDHGTGIPPEMKERLFESFFSTKSEGLGIGLNICRSILENHLGRLHCEDTPGGGTTFRFSIPLKASKLSSATPLPAKEGNP